LPVGGSVPLLFDDLSFRVKRIVPPDAEKKFSGAEELRRQIARDIASANRFFTRLRKFRILMLSN